MSFEELRAFLVVVDEGSFLSAAVSLGVSRTTLRRQVDALEANAGVPLLQRNRKGVVLTEAGKQLVRTGRVMEREFSALLRAIRETGKRPAGLVRVLLPDGMPPQVLSALYGFARMNWPEVRIEVTFDDAPLSMNLSDYDVVAFFGDGEPVGSWDTQTVIRTRQRLLASPAYLETRGKPRTVEELVSRHEIMAWNGMAGDTSLVTVKGDLVPIEPVFATPDVHLLHECALNGQGIAWAPDGELPTTLDGRVLVPLLEEVIGRDLHVRLAVPRSLAEVPKVRIFLDHLATMRAMLFGVPPPPPANAAPPINREPARRR